MKKIFLIIIMLGLFVCASGAEEVTKIVAKVNNEVITAKDLDDYYKVLAYKTPGIVGANSGAAKEKEDALGKLIEDRLILAEAKKKELQIPSYFVNGQLSKMIESYPSREDFENSLLERGLTVTVLKERILGQFLMRQVIDIYVSSYISVSPQEVNKYYEEHKAEMNSPERYSLWISQSKDKNKIVEIAKTIREKGIIAAETEYSDSLVKLEASMSELKDEVAQMVRGLKEGEQSVKTLENVNCLVYLEKIIPPKPLTLEEAQENVRNIIWNDKFRKRFEEWVKQLKDKAVIKTYL
ncbi:MAG: SurA N-terminal domain-containing protein [Candidatus Omnitrophica bacterium]|nr:SurA N-terminal domain-containing protein [Candidatus Omnitrophota bacterium]